MTVDSDPKNWNSWRETSLRFDPKLIVTELHTQEKDASLKKRTMSKLEYPRLPRNEIVSVLAEYQIASLSESDLLHPNPDFIANLYKRILYHVDLYQYALIHFTLTLIITN